MIGILVFFLVIYVSKRFCNFNRGSYRGFVYLMSDHRKRQEKGQADITFVSAISAKTKLLVKYPELETVGIRRRFFYVITEICRKIFVQIRKYYVTFRHKKNRSIMNHHSDECIKQMCMTFQEKSQHLSNEVKCQTKSKVPTYLFRRTQIVQRLKAHTLVC